MDKEAMIKLIKEFAAKPTGIKDYDLTLKYAAKHPDAIHGIDEDFTFDNDICVTICNGRCCTGNIDILITPPEIDAMLKMPALKDVNRQTFIKQNFDVFLGLNSNIPISTIKFTGDKGHKQCPFLLIGDKFLVAVTKTGEVIDVARSKQGLCAFSRRYKPIICRLFPLGRIGTFKPGGTAEMIDENTIFVCNSCPATSTDKKHNIRKFIEGYNELTLKKWKYVSEMTTIVDDIKKVVHDEGSFERMMNLFLIILFYADGETDDKVTKIKETIASGKKFLGMV